MCSRMESVGEVASGDDAHPMTAGTARKAGRAHGGVTVSRGDGDMLMR